MDKVGREGVITIEESKSMTDELDIVEGMRLDRGYLSAHFVTDAQRMEVSLDEPLILITDGKISTVNDIVPTLEKVAQAGGRPLAIIAEDVEGEALATLVVNKLRGTISCVGIKAARIRRPAQGPAGRHRHNDRRYGHQLRYRIDP